MPRLTPLLLLDVGSQTSVSQEIPQSPWQFPDGRYKFETLFKFETFSFTLESAHALWSRKFPSPTTEFSFLLAEIDQALFA